MSETYAVYSNGKTTIKVVYDDLPSNPREDGYYISTLACWHNRYDLGDKKVKKMDPEAYVNDLMNRYLPDKYDEYEEKSIKERLELLESNNKIVYLPVAIYDHSGITMYVGSRYDHYDGQWDCSDVGFIWVDVEEVYKEWGGLKGDLNHPDIEKIEQELTEEVKTYDNYLTGEVFGFIRYDGTEETDSCYGFYGCPNLKEDKNGLFDEAGVTEKDNLEEKDDFCDIEDFLLKNYPNLYEEKEEPETIMVRKVYTIV